jgi:hypothetical protein
MPPKKTVPKVTDHRATPDHRYETNMAKIESERLSVFAVTKDEWVDDQLMVKIQNSSSVYNVKIAKKPTCECPAAVSPLCPGDLDSVTDYFNQTFQGPICKHILCELNSHLSIELKLSHGRHAALRPEDPGALTLAAPLPDRATCTDVARCEDLSSSPGAGKG